METAALYIRVSTEEQTEYSPMAQLAELKEYAKSKNLIVNEKYIFKDEGISGRSAAHRPAFMEMIRLAKRKPRPFDVILCHKFDRFARSREDSVLYKALLKKDCGIRVISIREPLPEDGKFGVIYESMLEAMAEYYSLNLADEVKKTMVKKAENGEYQAHAPFGYRNESKTLALNSGEAEIVKMVFDMFLKGNNCASIARRLTSIGIKTKRGNSFDSRAVKYMLQNPVYIGFSRWAPDGRAGREGSDSTLIVKGSFPSIIDIETFYAVQAKIPAAKAVIRKDHNNLPFIGIIKCSSCGASLVCGESYKNGGCQLQCGRYNHGLCNFSHSVSSNIFEKSLRHSLNRLYSVSKTEGYTVALQQKGGSSAPALKSALNRLTKKLDKAKEAYLSGIDTAEEYKETKTDLVAKIDALKKQLNDDELKSEYPDVKIYPCLNKIEDPYTAIEKIVFCKHEKIFKVYFKNNSE